MNLTECPPNHIERKTPPPLPLGGSEAVKRRKPSAKPRDVTASSEGGQRGLSARPTCQRIDDMIAELIALGVKQEGDHMVWPDGRRLLLHTSNQGYRRFILTRKFIRYPISLARFTCWQTYGPAPKGKPFCDHINRVRNDDRPQNLRWASHKENARNISPETILKFRNRINNFNQSHPRLGTERNTAKLDDSKVLEMRKLYATGNYSRAELARMFGVSENVGGLAIKGKTWKHVPLVPVIRQRTGKGYYHRPSPLVARV